MADIKFIFEQTDMFLATLRKYMQLRGNLSQKDLAEKTGIGAATLSRFLNQKTKDSDPQVIARLVSFLEIPLHEIIDYVAEESTSDFKRLVKFYDPEYHADKEGVEEEVEAPPKPSKSSGAENDRDFTKAKTTATINVGGRTTQMPFGERRSNDMSIREKMETLTPRQKGFLTEFLDLNKEDRDLIVDVGDTIFRYFKQARMEY
jgi:transcriptional regulator with XRE-family HTH domain